MSIYFLSTCVVKSDNIHASREMAWFLKLLQFSVCNLSIHLSHDASPERNEKKNNCHDFWRF